MPWHPAKLAGLALAAAALQGCTTGPQPAMYDPSTGGVVYERRIIGAVNFPFDSYRITRDSYFLLDNIAAALNDPALAGLRFEINGHTDVVGRLGYNISLSGLRANEVVNYLAARGVPRERMRAQGFGPLQPYDPVNLRSPLNRRVEVVAIR